MSKTKDPQLFDQVQAAFGGYSPGGWARAAADGLVFFIERAAAVRSGVADVDAVVAGLNAQPLGGGVIRVELVERLYDLPATASSTPDNPS